MLLLRIGFILVQVGSIPVENAFIIIFRNIIEMATAIFSYGFIGYYLSFGQKSFYGVVNYEGFMGDKNADLSSAALGNASIGSRIQLNTLKYFRFLIMSSRYRNNIKPISRPSKTSTHADINLLHQFRLLASFDVLVLDKHWMDDENEIVRRTRRGEGLRW